jgi:hypothetical protein
MRESKKIGIERLKIILIYKKTKNKISESNNQKDF